MVTVVAVLSLWAAPEPAWAREARSTSPHDLFSAKPPRPRGSAGHVAVPLPRPRPAEADKAQSDASSDKPAREEAAKPAEPAKPEPSACRLALTDEVAIAPSIPDIKGPGGCGGEDLVRLETIVLPDRRQVPVKPAAILRCKMATAVADWIRTDMARLAQDLGTMISELDNFDSFECRGRNRVAGAMLSEHGRANALDVRSLKLASGKAISLTDRTVPRDVRERVLHSVCARFPTVLGPGSDWYHEDHIHLDLMERRNNYRICQWNVWDPLPPTAPLLPAERPEDAPPREAADKSDPGEAGRPEAAKSSGDEPENTPAQANNRKKKRR
jgi:hypothetical protein